jgi:hypothetical protein
MFVKKTTKYYKEIEISWEQPVLTSNGTLGGDSFAVGQSSTLDGESSSGAWKAFDGAGSNTRWHSAQGLPQAIYWYNPTPLKISNVKVTNRAKDGSYVNYYQLQFSDNNSDWVVVNVGTGESGDGVSWDIPVMESGSHKYWRIYITSASGSNNNYVAIGEIEITATTTTVIPGTPEDYTYKEETLKNYTIMEKAVIHKAGDFKRDFTVVGSPTIASDGVVSDFTSRNAIAVGEFRPNSYTWEIASVVTTGSDVSTNCGITGASNNKDNSCPVFGISGNSWRLLLSSNGSSWNIATDIKNGTVLPNTTYLVKLKFTGSQYLLEVDGNVVTTVNSTATIYQGGSLCFGNNLYSSSAKNPFLGSIDLSQSYIKINGKYWWTGFYTEDVIRDKYYAITHNGKYY